jgi:hypothetical protein
MKSNHSGLTRVLNPAIWRFLHRINSVIIIPIPKIEKKNTWLLVLTKLNNLLRLAVTDTSVKITKLVDDTIRWEVPRCQSETLCVQTITPFGYISLAK